MRNIATVIDQVMALMPDPAPPEVIDELLVLRAELKILKRVAAYHPPEADQVAMWNRLATALYRFLPDTGRPWAKQISDVVTSA